SDQFIAAQNFMAQGNIKDALVILEDLSKNAPGSYRMLSLFSKAGALLQQGSRDSQEQAITLLKEIENTKGVDAIYRDLAEILRYMQEVDILKTSDKALDSIRLRLDQLITDKGPWYPMALELKGATLYKVGAYQQAAEVFVQLVQDKQIPDAMKMRAQLMTQTLAAKLNTQKKK
ncbi:MAG: hypothetical protein Q8K36_04060, partial [Alphaproteobacteria bacterium]|nr:hypothetical protein [Alphaproteobacteria bacterium]